MTIYIASNNPKKIKEIQSFKPELAIASYRELSEPIDILETGTDYLANAKIKAETIGNKIKQPVIGDDGGLELIAKPQVLGIQTSRFFEKGATDHEMNQKILELLDGETYRRFILKASLIYYVSETNFLIEEKELLGTIAESQRGQEGYGFDYLLIPDGYNQTLAEMNADQRDAFSPRVRAFKSLLERIN